MKFLPGSSALTVIAGNGDLTGAPIPGPATSSPLWANSVAASSLGNVYVGDSLNHYVDELTPPKAPPTVPLAVHLANGPTGGALTTVATWSAPATASPQVTSYEVRIQPRSPHGIYSAYRYATVPGATRRLAIAGTRGYLYRVEVVARNSIGFGPWSAWSNYAYPR